MKAAPFRLFAADHWLSIAFTIIVSLLFIILVKKLSSDQRQYDRIGQIIGWIMICYEPAKAIVRPLLLHEPWQTTLPLNLCNLAVFALGLMLILKSYRLFEIAYFWGMGGGTMAVLTPDLAFGFPDPQYLMHNLTHTLIYIGVIYGLAVYRYRPTWHSFRLSFVTALGIMVIIFPLNYILGHGANFLFLRYRPQAGSLMDFLPEPPWHIPFVILLALIIYLLVFVPFVFRKK